MNSGRNCYTMFTNDRWESWRVESNVGLFIFIKTKDKKSFFLKKVIEFKVVIFLNMCLKWVINDNFPMVNTACTVW